MQILQKILQEIQKRRQWFQRNPKIINLQECKYPGNHFLFPQATKELSHASIKSGPRLEKFLIKLFGKVTHSEKCLGSLMWTKYYPENFLGSLTSLEDCPSSLKGRETSEEHCLGGLMGRKNSPEHCLGSLVGRKPSLEHCMGSLMGRKSLPEKFLQGDGQIDGEQTFSEFKISKNDMFKMNHRIHVFPRIMEAWLEFPTPVLLHPCIAEFYFLLIIGVFLGEMIIILTAHWLSITRHFPEKLTERNVDLPPVSQHTIYRQALMADSWLCFPCRCQALDSQSESNIKTPAQAAVGLQGEHDARFPAPPVRECSCGMLPLTNVFALKPILNFSIIRTGSSESIVGLLLKGDYLEDYCCRVTNISSESCVLIGLSMLFVFSYLSLVVMNPEHDSDPPTYLSIFFLFF
ncbi:hypothetical protein VP01_2306g1 [Puccinia sorghi]|uniref:Uncharacterized protein n=1 Tax=Puccinia sorghi TaxID=27349 RepID=A0A0L6V808_9BASI|nr:hypothetical protein VP01_2306g1 [Puccinia sorghi]